MPGAQHEAVGRDDHPAATAEAHLDRHDSGGHLRNQGLDLPLDGSQVGQGGRHGFAEGGGQVLAPGGGRPERRRCPQGRRPRFLWVGFGRGGGVAGWGRVGQRACRASAGNGGLAARTASRPNASQARQNLNAHGRVTTLAGWWRSSSIHRHTNPNCAGVKLWMAEAVEFRTGRRCGRWHGHPSLRPPALLAGRAWS